MSSALADHWVVHAVASAIVASLWQGAIIGACAVALLCLLRGAAPNYRYLVGCAALALLATSWSATLVTAAATQAAAPKTHLVVVRRIAQPSSLGIFSPPITAALPNDPAGGAVPSPWRARIDGWAVTFVPLWLLGVCFFSTRLAVAAVQVRRLRRATMTALPDDVLARVERLVQRVRVSRPVRLAQTTIVQVPMVVGSLRPLLLLPASALTGLSPAQLDAVIAHELAHIRRHDYLVNLAQTAVEILLFYHPAAWWLSRRIRDERELCCDDIAVAACGDRRVYAMALTRLEVLRPDAPALSVAATDGPLLRRVRRLVRPPSATPTPPWLAMAIPAVTLLVALATTTPLAARMASTPLATRTLVQLRMLAPLVVVRGTTPPQYVGRVSPKADPPQQSATPTPARVIPSDEGVIEGEVTDAGSRRPIAGASIDLVGPKRQFHVTTDPAGRFEATALEPGPYRVYVKAPGYLDSAYGARDVNDIGLLVDVAGGQVTSRIDVALQGAGAVSGRIVDAHGEGVAGVEVELVAPAVMPGTDHPAATAFAQSEAGGVFRFAEVTPGDYLLRAYASSDPPTPQQVLAMQACRMAPETCSVATRGTFYPGVAHADEAQVLHVDAGGELFGNDFTLLAGALRKVSGRIIAPGGDVSGAEVHLLGNGPGGGSSSVTAVGPAADGRFEFPKVPPDDYLLTVFDRNYPARYASEMRRVTVDDEDVADIQMVGHAGAHVEGRVSADPLATRRLDPSNAQVMFQFAVEGFGLHGTGGPRLGSDGRYSFDVPSGPQSIRVDRLPPGWTVRRIVVDGNDVDNNSPITFSDGGRARVDVVVTDRLTHLSGRVTDRRGRAVPLAAVLIFPVDPESWRSASDTVRQTRARQDGSFDIEGLPPAEYFVADATQSPSMVRFDATALERLSTEATRIRVRDGERMTVRVAAATGPRR